jgi:hypothetical protein
MCIAQVGSDSAFAGSSLILKAIAGSVAAVIAARQATHRPISWLCQVLVRGSALAHSQRCCLTGALIPLDGAVSGRVGRDTLG